MNKLRSSLGFLALSFILAACTSTPTLEEKPSSEFAGLNKVSGSGFSEAWARPGSKLSQYRMISVVDLQSADAEIKQPQTTVRLRKEWELTPQRQQALAETWNKAVATAADKQGLQITDAGDKVLRIEAELTHIAPSADHVQDQQTAGRSKVYTEDSGDASIEFRLYDQASNQLLAVIRDNRRVGSRMWGQSSTVTASADVRNLLNRWANQLLLRVSGN